MQHPVSELTEFYDALSRYLTGGGRDPGGADAYAMHRMLRDPQGRRETPDPHVLNELVAGEITAARVGGATVPVSEGTIDVR